MRRRLFIISATMVLAFTGCGGQADKGSTEATITETAGENLEAELEEAPVDVEEAAEAEVPVDAAEQTEDEKNFTQGESVDSAEQENAGFNEEVLGSLDDFVPPATQGETSTFDDFSTTMEGDFTGIWYDPDMGEAIWLTDDGAYVYIPFLELFGDELYEWELIDRSERGLCPELAIYYGGRDVGPLAYYVGGISEEYFWCVSQGQVFYRVDEPVDKLSKME